MPRGISRRELARRAGVTETTIRKRIEDGTLKPALLRDGRLDAELSERLLAAVITRGRFMTPALGKAQDRFLRAQVELLADEVGALQSHYVPVAAAEAGARLQMARLSEHFLTLPDAIASAAGLPAKAAFDHAQMCLHNVLTAISEDFLRAPDWWDEPLRKPAPPRPVAPSRVKAAKLNLAATKLEIERLAARGDLRPKAEVVREVGGRVATAKSLLIAIPGRVAERLSVASRNEARAVVAAELDGVLTELRPA